MISCLLFCEWEKALVRSVRMCTELFSNTKQLGHQEENLILNQMHNVYNYKCYRYQGTTHSGLFRC